MCVKPVFAFAYFHQ